MHPVTTLSVAVITALLGSGCRTELTSTPNWENYSQSSSASSARTRIALSRSKCSSPLQATEDVIDIFGEPSTIRARSHRKRESKWTDLALQARATEEASFDQLDSESLSPTPQPQPEEIATNRAGFRAVEGWYLGINAASQNISDDQLNGRDILVGTDTILLPKLDPGIGGGLSIGYRFKSMAFEFTYIETEHDAVHLGTKLDTTFSSFSVNLREFFRLSSRVQPFINLGLASTELEIKNGASIGLTVGDATLEDELSLNVGVGCSLYLTPRWSMNLLGEYRFFNNFFEVSGIATKGGSDQISADGVSVIGSLSYTM